MLYDRFAPPCPCLPRHNHTHTIIPLQTVVALSVRHIIRNPLITGIIRDVMFTFIAYVCSITTIVSDLHIFRKGTRITTVTWSVMNDRTLHRIASIIHMTWIITNSTIWFLFSWLVTVARASTGIYVLCFKTRIFALCMREETARRRRHLWDNNTIYILTIIIHNNNKTYPTTIASTIRITFRIITRIQFIPSP